MCLVQLIPAIGKMVRSESEDVKRKVAPFLRRFCFAKRKGAIAEKKGRNVRNALSDKDFNKSVRQMFIACGGIDHLVHALRNKYTQANKSIIFTAVDCLHEIFLSESRLHNKTDLARLYIKAKVLRPLCDRLKDIINDIDDANTAVSYGEKMGEILYRMAQLNSPVIKTAISGTVQNNNNNNINIGGNSNNMAGITPGGPNDNKSNQNNSESSLLSPTITKARTFTPGTSNNSNNSNNSSGSNSSSSKANGAITKSGSILQIKEQRQQQQQQQQNKHLSLNSSANVSNGSIVVNNNNNNNNNNPQHHRLH